MREQSAALPGGADGKQWLKPVRRLTPGQTDQCPAEAGFPPYARK